MNWLDRFDGLSGMDQATKDTLSRRSTILDVPAGTMIFRPGKPPDSLLLLLEGRIRVQQVTEGGREIVLYRVEAGQSCILTTAAMLADEDYAAEGIAETDARAAAIPRAIFDDLIARSRPFRNFIFQAYSMRIVDLFQVIEDVAFQRIDIRLAQCLIALARGSSRVEATHQQLAAELGTAREVISRQLGEFQRCGWIRQTRGVIDLINAAGIAHLAAMNGD
jgi:CRP/FNR family transcriptional regulator, anaerobic regulatory protein